MRLPCALLVIKLEILPRDVSSKSTVVKMQVITTTILLEVMEE
jgi:hypothetical protein